MNDPLESWTTLNREVMRLPEEELEVLMNREAQRSPEPRQQYLNRVYCRFSWLRRQRERAELGLSYWEV